jgi:hypothetical protein
MFSCICIISTILRKGDSETALATGPRRDDLSRGHAILWPRTSARAPESVKKPAYNPNGWFWPNRCVKVIFVTPPHLFMEAIMARTACKFSLLVALFFFLAFSPAWADGNSLLVSCQKYEQFEQEKNKEIDLLSAMQIGTCMGTVNGVFKTIILVDSVMPQNIRICYPNGFSTEQHIRIVIKFLKDNPEQLHLNEAYLIRSAGLKAYPCN